MPSQAHAELSPKARSSKGKARTAARLCKHQAVMTPRDSRDSTCKTRQSALV